MHVSEFTLENVTSYTNRTSFSLSPELNIFIGPNGGEKTNAIQCLWLVLEKFFLQQYTVEHGSEGREIRRADILSNRYDQYLEKSDKSCDSYVKLTVVPDHSDADNIRRIKKSIQQIDTEYHILRFADMNHIKNEHLTAFDENAPLQFIVKNGALIDSPVEAP